MYWIIMSNTGTDQESNGQESNGQESNEPDNECYLVQGITNKDILNNLISLGQLADPDRDPESMHELCGENLDHIPSFGTGSKAWILIGVYHETAYVTDILSGENDNDITAIIFADDRQSAIQQLYSHPTVIKDINDVKQQHGYDPINNDNSHGDSHDENRDILSIIFGDELIRLAQLTGNFIEVTDNIVNNIKPTMSSVEFLMTYRNYAKPSDIKP